MAERDGSAGVERIEADEIRGWLHRPAGSVKASLGLTHGAGSNCEAPLLVAVAEAFADSGLAVLRYDLPFRQLRPTGPPVRSAARDQEGVRKVARWLGLQFSKALYLGGHSYGGRMTTMTAAEDGALCHGLLLLSYPLHPPKQPEKLRTEHFPKMRATALFVHGTRDEFGTIGELQQAVAAIPARTRVQPVEGGHGLRVKYARQIAEWFVTFSSEC